jgi:sulfur carrier protein ThiS
MPCLFTDKSAMHLIIRLFAHLVQYRPSTRSGRSFTLDLPEDSKISDLIVSLGIPEDEVKTVFVNHIISPPDTILKEGDEVGIFSPIGGG